MGVKEYSLEPIGASKPGRCIVTLSHEKHYWPFARGIHRWPMNSSYKRPMVQSFYFFFDVSLSKLFSKLSSCGWYEMPRRPSDVIVVRHNLMRLLLQYIISNEICMRSCCACICCGYGGVPVIPYRIEKSSLLWRHNEPDGVSNHQPHDCLLNRFLRHRSKETSKCVTGLCAGNSPETGELPAQMASNAENVSIWWRHHGYK